MTTRNYIPYLNNHSLIGFDRLLREMERSTSANKPQNFPPYNLIQKTDGSYHLIMAIAGFRKEDITVELTDDHDLVISGRAAHPEEAGEFGDYPIHRGLALRDFTRSFKLDETLKVKSAEMKDGLLYMIMEPQKKEENHQIIDIM